MNINNFEREYSPLKAVCTMALEQPGLKPEQEVRYLLDRSEASRLMDELVGSLQDAQRAISIQPSNPKCSLSLALTQEAISTKLFQAGINKDSKNQEVLELRRLRVLQGSPESDSRLLSLGSFQQVPKELFEWIFSPISPSDKIKCLRVSKGWKDMLESDQSLWRDLDIRIRDSATSSLQICELFALNSGNTLRNLKLRIDSLDYSQRESLFGALERSSNTLRKLQFEGEHVIEFDFYDVERKYKEKPIIGEIFELASKCQNLQEFSCQVMEEGFMEELDDREAEEYDELEDDEMDREEALELWMEATQQTLVLDSLEFKSFPSIIKISSSKLTAIKIGNGKFFSKAKVIKLDFEDSDEECIGSLSFRDVEVLLRVSRKTLRFLEIDRMYAFESSKKWDSRAPTKAIQLPNLRHLKLQAASRFSIPRTNPITIVAPRLKKFELKCEQFIVLQSE